MIRKPTEKDFEEGTAVVVLRETKRTAVETQKGLARGVQGIVKMWLLGTMWFGILVTCVAALGSKGSGLPILILIGMGVCIHKGGGWLAAGVRGWNPGGRPQAAPDIDPMRIVREGMAMEAQAVAGAPVAAAPAVPSSRRQSGAFKLAVPIAARQAVSLCIPGVLLLFMSVGMGPFALIPAIFFLGTALLIGFKAAFDRDLLSFDHQAIVVNNLLSRKAMNWADVQDVQAKVFSRLNFKVLATVGTRRTIALTGRGIGGMTDRLLVPIDLLDLDEAGLTALVADLLCCRAAAGAVVPAWQPQAPAPPPAYKPTATSDPRESFDPDAIMARYMAERAALIEEVRPDLAQSTPMPASMPAPISVAPRAFGRKVA